MSWYQSEEPQDSLRQEYQHDVDNEREEKEQLEKEQPEYKEQKNANHS